MATPREVKDAQGNKAEAAATPSPPVPAEDISVPTDTPGTTATPAQQAEGQANEAEARQAEKKRQAAAKKAESAFGQGAVQAYDHNAQNRRISALLREKRSNISVAALAGENQKLKMQVKRLEAGQALARQTPPVAPVQPSNLVL